MILHAVWLKFIKILEGTRTDSPRLSNSYVSHVQHRSNFAQVRIEYTYGQLYMYIQKIPVYIQTLTHWNLIGHSMTAPPLVLSPSSILPPLSRHYVSIAAEEKFGACLKKSLFLFFTFLNCVGVKLRRSGNVYTFIYRVPSNTASVSRRLFASLSCSKIGAFI
jgi:hypothetical protein